MRHVMIPSCSYISKWLSEETETMPKIVIIADDLTGATDSAAACAEYGMKTMVLLAKGEYDDPTSTNAEVVAIDANTRCCTADQAALITEKLVQRYGKPGEAADQPLLLKKVDSTLRGHLAVELAAALKARRDLAFGGEKVVVMFAPAFPAQGRTTAQGRQMLHGIPLEETDFGRGEQVHLRSSITDILGEAGLSCGVVDIATVRSGVRSLETAMIQLADTVDLIVCDALNDEDLRLVASASLALGPQIVWAGSAGLARQMPSAAGLVAGTDSLNPAFKLVQRQGATLFVVGSLANASREQARVLAAAPNVKTLNPELSALLNEQSPESGEYAKAAVEALHHGNDVLLLVDFPDRYTSEQSNSVMRSLARIVQPCSDLVGALVATGGETARTVLDAWGVNRLRLLGEIEPGLPCSMTEGWSRDIPVLTKAGGFGTPETFLRCREFLQATGRDQHTIAQTAYVVENQS